MGGFFGAVSHRDVSLDVFFGVDYHSHLGTKRGGMVVYDAEKGEVLKSCVVDTQGHGHGALAGFLKELGVDVLICGGIGGGAQAALNQAGIQFYGGVRGDADEAVAALLANQLIYNPCVTCSHHSHEGACGDHGCGSHSCH